MSKIVVENPLADLVNRLGTVRVVWGIIGTIMTTIGFQIPFVSPDLFTTAAFDEIIGFVVGTVGAGLTIYQTYFRKVVVTPGAQTVEVIKAAKVPYGPFGNVVV